MGPGRAKSGILGDDLGILSFDPPMRPRMARLRRQGASIDLAVAPYRYSPATVACVTFIAAVVGVLLTGCALMMTGVALAMDLMLLVPMIALAHLLLRLLFGRL
jgi:hypothetical protein